MRIVICLLLTFVVNCSSYYDQGLMDIVQDLDKEMAFDYIGHVKSSNDIWYEKDSSDEDETIKTDNLNSNKVQNEPIAIKDDPEQEHRPNPNTNNKHKCSKHKEELEPTKTINSQIKASKDLAQHKVPKTYGKKSTDDNKFSHQLDDEDNYDSYSDDDDDDEDDKTPNKNAPTRRPAKMKQKKTPILPTRQKSIEKDTTISQRENINISSIGSLVPQGLECQQSFKIHNGGEVDPAATTLVNYPFVVSIQRRGSHYATGALLNTKWILSVAGEFYNVRESIKLFRVRLGSVDNKHGGLVLPLRKIVIHPDYVKGQPNFDLAMLRIGQLVECCDYIKPISISNFTSKVIGGRFLTMYWPRLILKGKPLPPTASERTRQNSLRVSTQKMIPPAKCKKMMQNITWDDSTLCLKPFVSHHSVCVPDAGAPVVGEDGIWGITSGWVSDECQKNPSPYVFSRLSSMAVRSWLTAELLGE